MFVRTYIYIAPASTEDNIRVKNNSSDHDVGVVGLFNGHESGLVGHPAGVLSHLKVDVTLNAPGFFPAEQHE